MAKPTGFFEYRRVDPPKRSIDDRKLDYREIERLLPLDSLEIQASRCMDCGIPYCHSFGCPLMNRVPDFNEMIYRKQWRKALDILHSTNNFPEVTGRICPALCEAACTLSIDGQPVTIRHIELQIVERGWKEGWISPEPPEKLSGRKVAIIGSGPAGLSAAQELMRKGHEVTVFEKDDRIGGILRYGIPDFKLEKWVLDRRLEQLRQEGIRFETGVDAGTDLSVRYLDKMFDAILIASGSRVPRELDIPGRDLSGVHLAMDYLIQQNRIVAGDSIPADTRIIAEGKDVVVIGGGDTGSDCVGTAIRQNAKSVTQIELLPKPPADRAVDNPWPTWPMVMRTSSSHEEGCERMWSVQTKEFAGKKGHVESLHCVKLNWLEPDENGRRTFQEVADSGFELKSQLVLLALGFIQPEHNKLVEDLNLGKDKRGNIEVSSNWMTTAEGVFATGDTVSGASLVVRAIHYGRLAAAEVHKYLSGK